MGDGKEAKETNCYLFLFYHLPSTIYHLPVENAVERNNIRMENII